MLDGFIKQSQKTPANELALETPPEHTEVVIVAKKNVGSNFDIASAAKRRPGIGWQIECRERIRRQGKSRLRASCFDAETAAALLAKWHEEKG
jgi:hypothetical protein